ncbi:MAG: hypothetical protein M1835_002563 [Candelina submexicana]|nr:MAG: hypothetical protein M1835_002563 [Candelina submexicana]
MHGHPEAHQHAVTADDQEVTLSEPTSAHNENKTGHSIAVDLSDPALALTTSQKDQYTVPSKHPSQPGVTPTAADMFGFGDPFARFPGESSTIPNTTPVEAPSKDVEVSASTKTSTGSSELLQHLLPSSPPVDPKSLAASASASQHSKGLRRSKSSQPVQQPSPNALLESMASTNGLTSPTVKARRNRRTATIAAIKTQDPHDDAPNLAPNLGTLLADTTIGGAVRQEISEINEADGSSKVALQEPKYSKEVASGKGLQADELGSDEIAIGLPKEQYKPRPSRSRSIRNADSLVETVDFSKRPEAQARARIKRSKTLGATPKANSSTDLSSNSSDKLEESKTIEIATKVKRKKIGDPEKVPEAQQHPAEIVTEDETIHDSIVSEALAPDKATAELEIEHEHHTLPEQAYSIEALQGEQQGSVQHPEPADQPTTNDSRLPESLPEAQKEAEMISIPKPRGRPRKTSQAPKARKRRKTEDSPNHPSEEPTTKETTNPPIVTHNHPPNSLLALAEIDGNLAPTKPLNPIPTTTPENKPTENGSRSTPSPPQPPSEILTPKKRPPTTSSSGKGPDKHSPLNSGKVPYRVGLSKRARIEPLLRVVKK